MNENPNTSPAPADCRRELGNVALCTEGRHGADTCPHFRGDVGEIGCQFIGTRVIDKGAWMVTSNRGRNTNVHIYTCSRPTADAPAPADKETPRRAPEEMLKGVLLRCARRRFSGVKIDLDNSMALLENVKMLLNAMDDVLELQLEEEQSRLCKPEPKGKDE